MAKNRSDRFPLLIYTDLGRRWGRMGVILMVASGALWLVTPRLGIQSLWRPLALFPVLVGGILFVYGFAARKMAYVQCFPTTLRIQTPIYPLVISYRRVVGTRPTQLNRVFDPAQEKTARRSWPSKFWTMTAVVIDMKGLPVNERWLRLWFNRYLFWEEGTGFVLLVEDWMGLSHQMDGFRATYRTQRRR